MIRFEDRQGVVACQRSTTAASDSSCFRSKELDKLHSVDRYLVRTVRRAKRDQRAEKRFAIGSQSSRGLGHLELIV